MSNHACINPDPLLFEGKIYRFKLLCVSSLDLIFLVGGSNVIDEFSKVERTGACSSNQMRCILGHTPHDTTHPSLDGLLNLCWLIRYCRPQVQGRRKRGARPPPNNRQTVLYFLYNSVMDGNDTMGSPPI